MFGQSTFASTPFATLFGRTVLAFVSESTQVQEDQFSALAALNAAVVDEAHGVDSLERGLMFFVNIEELGRAIDTLSPNTVLGASIDELASGLDVYIPLREANVYPTGIQLTIRIGTVLIWAQINDDQTPNWIAVTNENTTVWVQIDDDQATGWTQIPT